MKKNENLFAALVIFMYLFFGSFFGKGEAFFLQRLTCVFNFCMSTYSVEVKRSAHMYEVKTC